MILTRVRPSLYISVWVLVWSVISASTAAARNYSQLIVIRFFLGIVEAPFFPGALFLLASWYPRRQLALRTAILYSGLILATAFSGLIAAGIFEGLDGVRGIKGWRWLFILEGAASFAAGILGLVLLPDFPTGKTGLAKWFLTEEERKVAVERMARDRVSLPEAEHGIWYGLKLAVTDIRTLVFVCVPSPSPSPCVMLVLPAAETAKRLANVAPGCHAFGKPQCLRVHKLLPDHRQGL